MHARSPAEISSVRAFGYYLRGSHASVRLLANRPPLGRECRHDQSIYYGVRKISGGRVVGTRGAAAGIVNAPFETGRFGIGHQRRPTAERCNRCRPRAVLVVIRNGVRVAGDLLSDAISRPLTPGRLTFRTSARRGMGIGQASASGDQEMREAEAIETVRLVSYEALGGPA